MAFPLERMPTLREFIDAAAKDGCTDDYREIQTSRGVIPARHLVSPDGKVYYPLPVDLDERLNPELMASASRATGTRAFIHLYQHLL